RREIVGAQRWRAVGGVAIGCVPLGHEDRVGVGCGAGVGARGRPEIDAPPQGAGRGVEREEPALASWFLGMTRPTHIAVERGERRQPGQSGTAGRYSMNSACRSCCERTRKTGAERSPTTFSP